MRKFCVAMLVAAVLAMGLPARAGERAKADRVALAVYNAAPAFIQEWLAAIREHPAVKDGSVELKLFNGIGEQTIQDMQFSTILTQGYDAIILIANDMTFSTLMVQMAAQRGVPVVASCAQINSNEVASFIGCDDEVSGYLNAKAVLEKMGGEGNVVVIKGPPVQGATIHRDAGIARALGEFPGVKTLEIWPGNWSRNEAMQLMRQWLINHEGRINGVIAQNDEMALGAIDAMKAANVPILPVVGIDGIPEAVEAVKKGEMVMTLYQNADIEAQGALDIVLRRLRGPSYEPLSEAWKDYPGVSWNDGGSKWYILPWKVITGEK